MWASFWNNKTKVLGIIISALGFIQGYPGLHDLLSKQAYAWTMFLIGLLVFICGMLNTTFGSAPPNQKGFARVGALVILAFGAVAATSALPGCASTREAYQQAQREEDAVDATAYVVAEHYASLVKQAADLKESTNVPLELVAAMQVADKRVNPAIVRMKELRDSYKNVRSAETEAELQKAVDEAVLLLSDLISAVNDAEGVLK